jgi:hypothetical protein
MGGDRSGGFEGFGQQVIRLAEQAKAATGTL